MMKLDSMRELNEASIAKRLSLIQLPPFIHSISMYIYIYNKRIFYYHLEFVFNNKYNQPLNVKFISREIKQTIFPQFFKF